MNARGSDDRAVVVSGAFDDLQLRHVRLLEEASKLGSVHAFLWSDEEIRRTSGREPRFGEDERFYLLQSLRYVSAVTKIQSPWTSGGFAQNEVHRGLDQVTRVMDEMDASSCAAAGFENRVVIPDSILNSLPPETPPTLNTGGRKVMATGCFDWLHSGHVRFFEEAAAFGALTVVVGSDRNVRLLKGDRHPLFPERERRYMVAAVRAVACALVSTGTGWLDAEPEIRAIRPDAYIVNEDGDRPEKRAFCGEHGIEYIVLKRQPAPGLPRRESTVLRGF